MQSKIILLLIICSLALVSSTSLKHRVKRNLQTDDCEHDVEFRLRTRMSGLFLFVGSDKQSVLLAEIDAKSGVWDGSSIWIKCAGALRNVETNQYLVYEDGRFYADSEKKGAEIHIISGTGDSFGFSLVKVGETGAIDYSGDKLTYSEGFEGLYKQWNYAPL